MQDSWAIAYVGPNVIDRAHANWKVSANANIITRHR